MSTPNQDLRVSYVQTDLVWEDPIANCAQLEEHLQKYALGKLVNFKEILEGIDNSNFILETSLSCMN